METSYKVTTVTLSSSIYPTYEEWKRLFKEGKNFLMCLSIYPTYEEWKRSYMVETMDLDEVHVFTLPMRNGNS